MNSIDLSSLETILKTQVSEVYHYAAPEGVTRYIVYAEYGENPLFADDTAALILPTVQIDVYTQTEADTLPGSVEAALRAAGLPVRLQATAYDDETASLRTILRVELV